MLLIFALCTINALGCAIAPVEHQVPRDFSVQVLDWKERPVASMHVLLRSIGVTPNLKSLEQMTDENGRATFEGTPLGQYEVTIDEPRGNPDYNNFTPVYISVVKGPASSLEKQVRLPWPDRRVLVARSASGRVSLDPPWLRDSFPRVMLDLRDSRTRRLMATTGVGTDGSFSFPEVGPGLYFVDTRMSDSDREFSFGSVAVEVDRTAQREHLDFLVYTLGGCGQEDYIER